MKSTCLQHKFEVNLMLQYCGDPRCFPPGQREAAAESTLGPDLLGPWKPVWDGMGVFQAITPVKERDTHCITTEITGKDSSSRRRCEN